MLGVCPSIRICRVPSAAWADARRRDAGDAVTSSRSANAADARPPPRPFWLRPAGSLAALLASHILSGMLGARALPASLGASSKVGLLLRDRPLALSLFFSDLWIRLQGNAQAAQVEVLPFETLQNAVIHRRIQPGLSAKDPEIAALRMTVAPDNRIMALIIIACLGDARSLPP